MCDTIYAHLFLSQDEVISKLLKENMTISKNIEASISMVCSLSFAANNPTFSEAANAIAPYVQANIGTVRKSAIISANMHGRINLKAVFQFKQKIL